MCSRNQLLSFWKSAGKGEGWVWAVAVALALLPAAAAHAQPPQVKIENPDVGHQTQRLGESVSIDGETMIAGSPLTDLAGLVEAGVAWVYKTDGAGGWNIEAELVAADTEASAHFGNSVAISGDTAVVGAYRHDSGATDSGAVYVFTRTGTVWSQQQKLTASDGAASDFFGSSVSISGDTIIVGAINDDDGGSNSGSAYVFTRSAGIWTEQQKLTASDAALDDYFGYSVSVSLDTALVGAYRDDDAGLDSGSTYVFTRSAGVWTEQQKLTASDAAADAYFGLSVSLSGDTALIGAPYDDAAAGSSSGAAYVFTRSGAVWSEQQKLTAFDAAMGDYFGISVHLSGDTAIIGSFYDDNPGINVGSAYVFTRSLGVWSLQGKLGAPDGASEDRFGWSVAGSGDLAVIGAPYDDDKAVDSGSLYVFDRSPGVWLQQAKMNCLGRAMGDSFGWSVAISGDTAIVGSSYDEDAGVSLAGSATVFIRSAGSWIPEAKLEAADAGAWDSFGNSVSFGGSTAVVGSPWHDDAANDSGSAYVFTRSSGFWTQQQKLTAFDAAASDAFGRAVQIWEDTVVVGASGDDDGGADSGSAYVFVRSGDVWTLEQKLVAADAAAGDNFGYSVSISGDTVLIGADSNDDPYSNSGAAYVFTRSGGVWTQEAKLVATDSMGGEYFGFSVSVSGDTALIGAYSDSDAGGATGSAYVFTRTGGVWTQEAKLLAADMAGGDRFGGAVSLSADRAIIGAYWDDDAGSSSGSAYLFTRTAGVWTQDAKLTAGDAAAQDQFGFSVATDGLSILVGAVFDDGPEVNSGAAYVFSLDSTPPTSSAIVSNWSQAGGDIDGTYNATDEASGIATVALYVKEPGGAWTNAGNVTGGAWAFTPTAGDGLYEFTTIATDNATNSETAPPGPDAGQASVLYNNAENDAFTAATIADGAYTFPMTDDLDVIITFSGGATGGPVTLSRTVGDVSDGGYDATRLIDEFLSITGTFTGTATIEWQYADASDDTLAGPLNAVFQFEGGSIVNQYAVTPTGTTITIPGVTAFSDWYAGSNDATVDEWLLLND